MATLSRAEPPATEHRPLFIAFDKVMRTGKDNGVTLYGVSAKFSDGTEFKFEKDQVTLYDSHFGPKEKEGPLTKPCKVYLGESGYWDVRPLPVGQKSNLFDRVVEEVLATPKAAEKKPERQWGGVGGKGGGGKTMTKGQLDAAIAYSMDSCAEVMDGVTWKDHTSADAAQVFCKILGCAMFVEWPGEERPSDDDDGAIPF